MSHRSRALAAGPAAALLFFAAVAGAFRVRAYDLFWHLAAGRWIVEHRRPPRSDPFRFTHDGAPWIDHEWLFQVVAYGLERLAGTSGLGLLRSAAAVALAGLLLAALRRSGAPVAWAVPAVLAALLGARPRLFLRPELVTLLAIPLLLALLQELRRSKGRRRLALSALAVALVLVWANAHPGALAAPPLALAFLVGTRLPGGLAADGTRAGVRPVPWRLVLGLPLALAAVLLVNPYGAAIVSVPGAIGASLEELGGVNPEWLPLWHPWIARDSLYFFTVAGALAALALVTFRRTRRLDPATGLTTLALAALAATSIRHQSLFYVGAVFFAGECLAALQIAPFSLGPSTAHRSAPCRSGGRGTPPPHPRAADAAGRVGGPVLAIVLCLLAALWAAVPPTRGPLAPRQGRYTLGVGVEPGRFPEHLAGAVAADWPEVGHLYNNVAWGGYLLWRLYPPRQVFVDGRNEVDPQILRELAAARRSSRAWEELLARYDVDGAVVRYEERPLTVLEPPAVEGGEPAVVRRTPHAVLFPRERFALVDWDDAGMLLVRRTPERAARLARVEYRFLDPEDRAWTLARAQRDPSFRAAALAEAERRLREGPPSRRARDLAAALAAGPAAGSRPAGPVPRATLSRSRPPQSLSGYERIDEGRERAP